MTAVTAPSSARLARTATGIPQLLRFMLRRDRIKLPAWTLGITFFVFYFTTALPTIAPTEADLAAFANFADGPVGAILSGPGYGFGDGLTYEVFLAGTYGLYFLLATALMNILLVSRHTRVEEQSGRAELIRAGVVGRNAPLFATMILATGTNVVLALLLSGALLSVGYPPTGSFVFGASVGALGLVFAGITTITVQVTEYSRAASGLAGVALGAAYLLRAVGDSLQQHGSLLSWFSPLAWSQQTRPYVDERWWPLLLSLGFAGITAAVGYRLAARRDIGAGLRATRGGSATAAPWLRSPVALAFRLQRASILGWGSALVVLGLTYGLLVGPMSDTFENLSEDFAAIIAGGGADLLDGYVSFMALYDVVLVAVFGILAVKGLRAEEARGRAEPVLAAGVGRVRWVASHLLVAYAAATAILLVAGLSFGIGAAIGVGDPAYIATVTFGHLARAPEAFVFMALAAALYGVAPRVLGLAWAVLVYASLLAFFGPLLDPPAWLHDLSPLDHIARIPVEDFTVLPVVVLLAIAGLLTSVGLLGFRRRDLGG